MTPSKNTDKAFFLFARTLAFMNKIAIGQVVIRERQQLCAIRPYKNLLLMTTLNYDYEVRKLDTLEVLKTPKITPKELSLAEELINGMSVKSFDIKDFKDTFIEELKKHLSKPTKTPAHAKKAKQTQEVTKERKKPTLMDLLNESLATTKKAKKHKTTKTKRLRKHE